MYLGSRLAAYTPAGAVMQPRSGTMSIARTS